MSTPILFYILVTPLLGALLTAIFSGKVAASSISRFACISPLASFAMVVAVAFFHEQPLYFIVAKDWLPYGELNLAPSTISLYMDNITKLMLLLITGVGSLIHIYSLGYMEHDRNQPRFFAYLNLFIFFMLLLVLSNNLLGTFIGWEGVGLCSYLLIGFWYDDAANAIAGKKAFIVNRVGDAGFILGMLMLFDHFGTLDILPLTNSAPALANLVQEPSTILTIAALLLFLGAVGKSAQFPLMVWLPDAMAGPTPVSALIHAATMVTAGVYMTVRLNFIFTLTPLVLEIIALVGIATALIAALTALAQNDIKKVLAYSTVSQLGYMFLGLGVGAYGAAMFHLITHGFFKALLFLSAGSVIHAMQGEQNIERMGGLKNYLIPTTLCFGVGCAALSGFPLLSGWFSKGQILGQCAEQGRWGLWGVGVFTAMLTAIYTVRLFVKVFLGTPNISKIQLAKLHESPSVMLVPMAILTILSFIGGYTWFGVPHLASGANLISNHNTTSAHHVWITLLETALIVGALAMAWWKFTPKEDSVVAQSPSPRPILAKSFYLDELITGRLGVGFTMAVAKLCHWFEIRAIENTQNFLGVSTRGLGVVASTLQRSNVVMMMMTMLIGILALLWVMLWK